MPIFEANKLRDEEQFGGFEPGESGDESFKLESMPDYDGDMPAFLDEAEPDLDPEKLERSLAEAAEAQAAEASALEDDIEEAIPEEIEETVEDDISEVPVAEEEAEEEAEPEAIDTAEEVIDEETVAEAEKIEAPEKGGSVWDLFDDDDEEDFFSGKKEAEPEPEPEPVVEEELEPEPEPEEMFEAPDDDFDMNADMSIQDEVKTEEVDEAQEQVVDDLKDLIKNEMEKSKERRADTEEVEAPKAQESVQEEPPEEFIPVDAADDAKTIDFSDINAQHPSTFSEDFESAASDSVEEEDMEMAAPVKKTTVRPEDAPKKDKKEKKAMPWMKIIVSSAAAIFLVSVSIISYYYFWGSDKIDHTQVESDSTKVDMAHNIEKEEPKDTAKAQEEPEVKKDTVEEEEKSPIDTVIQVEVEKPEPKKEITKKPEPRKNVVHKPKVKKVRKPKQVSTRKIDKKVPENKELAEVKVDKKSKREMPKEPPGGLFTVQVYASPSKADAGEWLSKLQQLKVQNPFITEQKVRDQVWYRVRFGEFSSRQEARAAALRFGFAQSWIDRVR